MRPFWGKFVLELRSVLSPDTPRARRDESCAKQHHCTAVLIFTSVPHVDPIYRMATRRPPVVRHAPSLVTWPIPPTYRKLRSVAGVSTDNGPDRRSPSTVCPTPPVAWTPLHSPTQNRHRVDDDFTNAATETEANELIQRAKEFRGRCRTMDSQDSQASSQIRGVSLSGPMHAADTNRDSGIARERSRPLGRQSAIGAVS
jgi:hypothetical protein